MAYETNALHMNKEKHQFEMEVDNSTAFISYKQNGDVVYLVHTETPPQLEGKGVASALVEKTVTYIDNQHLHLVPLCHFVQSYLDKHPQWKHLVITE